MGQLGKALEYYGEETKLFEELHRANPSDVSFKNGLAISYTKLAGVYFQQKDVPAAKINYQAAAAIWADMATQYPEYAEFNNNLQWVENRLKGLGDV